MLEDYDLSTLIEDRSVGCALPDLRYALALVLGVVVVASALAIALLRKMRPW